MMSQTSLRSVLVVDDDASLRRVILDYAEAMGTSAWEATNGLEALWIVKHRRPELVLLDLRMPRLDGFETVRHLRRFDPSIRIVIVTGDRSEETRQRVTGLGLALLVKPFAISDLDGVFTGKGLP